jgi:hypothetical protein
MIISSGLEAIAVQKNPLFYNLLTAEFARLMELSKAEGKTTKAMMDNSKIAKITMDCTGIKAEPGVDEHNPCNAYVLLPSLNSYHVFFDEWRRAYIGYGDAFELFRKMNNALIGTVDLQTSKVGGVFSMINFPICLSFDLMVKYDMTPGMIAAIYMHEVGHAFTILECIHYTATTNLVLQAGIEAIIQAETSRKHAILTDVQNSLGIVVDDPKTLIESDRYEGYAITILSKYNEKIVAALGGAAYDESMSEQMADMFAVRHGAGLDLARGLSKIQGAYRSPGFLMRTFAFIFSTIFSLGMNLVLGTLGTLLISTLGNMFGGTYDRGRDRFIRMRNEAIMALKDENVEPKMRALALETVAGINEVLADKKNELYRVEKLAFILRSSQRDRYRSKVLQQDLEALLNNPLYVSAAKLKTLNKDS